MHVRSKPFVIPIFIPHAGCPHRCVFCDQTHTTGQPEPLPADDQLDHTIRQFLGFRRDPGRFTEIAFYGGNFLGQAKPTIESLFNRVQPYIQRGDVQGIRFSTRPDTIDDERMWLIRDYPVTTIELGVQTMDDELLQTCRRGHSAEQIRLAVGQLRRLPYRLGVQMMVGLPGENSASALATAKQISAWAPDFVRIYPTLVLEGSPLERWYRQGRYTPLALDEAVIKVKALYRYFLGRQIPVVRMGLQPTQDLNADMAIVAGPFHPAFGELVHGALWRDLLVDAFEHCDPAQGQPSIRLNPKILSRVKGQRNENLWFILDRFQLPGIAFDYDDRLPLDAIAVNGKQWSLMKIQN